MRDVRRRPLVLALGAALALAVRPALPQATVGPRRDYAPVAAMLERFIAHEMSDKQLPALSIALVDDQEIVWARGFGYARPRDSVPATAATVYRVGSVSKLFTDLAVMRLVERGEIDLDAPVARYLPDFQPGNPFGKAITLRQLMAHRSGLVREPPAGNYFDPTAPTLAATIASLNRTTLVYQPETHTKYSNAAIATVGYALERTQGRPFTSYLRGAVLEPLGLRESDFAPTPAVARKLATAFMWAPDGRRFQAPTFQLGIAPAGSMYTTVTDLGRFVSVLFAAGRGPKGQVVRPETLERMWTPQFADSGAKTGFGIGFYLSDLDGHREIGHDGAIYGFATTLAALPDDRVGAIAVTTLDAANTVTDRVVQAALRGMLAARAGQPIPEPVVTERVPAERARSLVGRYVRGQRQLELRERGGDLFIAGGRGGALAAVRARGDSLFVDDPGDFGFSFLAIPGGLVVRGDTFRLEPLPKPAPAPERWNWLVGEYGWDHDALFIYERQGTLYALIEWFFAYALDEVSDSVFAFPKTGLYDGERLIFRRDTARGAGRAREVAAAGVVFQRRAVGPEDGKQLRLTAQRPVPTLLREALGATPPSERGEFRAPDLVDLASLDSTIRFDIRYATTNNFLGSVFYASAHAFLQRPAAEALVRAHRRLKERGYGLLIHDAYRPWYVTKVFWDATPAALRWLVADPRTGSKHNRGCAVDLTLYDLATGQSVDMGGTYDESTERSFSDYPVGTTLEKWHRDLLREALEAQGFSRNPEEWWHFDHQDWRKYPILNRTFEQLTRASSAGP